MTIDEELAFRLMKQRSALYWERQKLQKEIREQRKKLYGVSKKVNELDLEINMRLQK